MPKNKWLERPVDKRLTIKQHLLPAASIRRFCEPDGKVEVFLRDRGLKIRTVPTDKTFCAERVWDQRAESGALSRIEGAFQALASRIVAGEVRSMTGQEQDQVSEMYALWRYRFRHRHGAADWKLKVATPPPVSEGGPAVEELTKEREEILELGHVQFFRADGTYPARQAIGMQLQIGVDVFMEYAQGKKWGILRANDGEFLVPDTYGEYNVMPVSPGIVLALENPDSLLNSSQVGLINQHALATFDQYVFARSLAHISLPYVAEWTFPPPPFQFLLRK